jgi:erythromycin esterase
LENDVALGQCRGNWKIKKIFVIIYIENKTYVKEVSVKNLTVLFFYLFLVLVSVISGQSTAAGSEKDLKNGSWLESLNLDFEKPALEGWILRGEGFRVQLDPKDAAGGKQCLGFTFEREMPDIREGAFGLAACSLPVQYLVGKRLRLSAALKTRELAGYFLISLRAEAGEDPVAVTRIPDEDIPQNTTPWKRYSIEMDIPQEVTALYFGAVIRGKGTAWVDEISLEVLPAKGPPAVDIAGKVVDKDGKPVPGALVATKTYYSETTPIRILADQEGKFTFRLLPGGYMLSATASELTGGVLPFRNFQKDVNNLVITLAGEGFTIKGKVKTPQGLIPQEAYVVANKLDSFGGDLFYSEVQADGSYQVTVPKGTAYKVQLDTPGMKAMPMVTRSGSDAPCDLEALVPQQVPEEVVSWIKQQAVVLQTTEAGHGFADLQPLKEIITDARVVGLGETSHGTREIFRMKHRLLEFLVTEMGFTVFVMEVSWSEALAVNDYVLNGKGDPARLMAGMHVVWDTREVLALIEWMRAYNANPAHREKVKFYGADIQDSRIGAEYVTRYLEKVDPELLKPGQAGQVLSILRDRRVYGIFYRYSQQECMVLKNQMNEFLLHFDREKGTYVQKSSEREWREVRHLVRFLQQFVSYVVAGVTSDYDALDIRDRAMAENISWILDYEPAGTRVVYWAHNYHIAMAQYPAFPANPMGMHLQQVLGRDYISIGFEFNRGTFQSRDSTPTQTPFLIKSFTLDSIPGSFAAGLSRTGIPMFLLDLRRLPGQGVVHNWFFAPRIFKSIDSVFANEKDIQHWFKVPVYFDVVIFFENTTRSQPNPMSLIPRLLY